MKIAITTSSFGDYDVSPIDVLKQNGFEVKVNPYKRVLTKEEIVKVCSNAVGIIAGTETMQAETLGALSKLKVISRCGTGIDNVDLNVAKKLGIKVFNTPDAPTLAVAELTIVLMLNLLRKVSQMDREFRDGQWQKRMGNLLSGKKVGIKGFGRIGRKVAELLKAFGCKMTYADPFVEDGLLGLQRLSLEDLLKWADIVTVHIGVKERLIGERELHLMKKGAWLINTARGGIVDEDALYISLKKGHLAGAALDVFEREPYNGPLKELDNVILTPHIGSYAIEARMEMEMQAVENLIKGLKHGQNKTV